MTNDFKNKQSSGARPPRLSPEEYAAKKKAEKEAIYQLLDNTASEVVQSPEKFKAYLDVQSRMDRYTANNALLMYKQFPQASQIKEFDDWAAEGVKVNKGSKTFIILDPYEYAILFIRGELPVMDLKYDILKHPNVAYTADGKGGVYQHGEVTKNVATIETLYVDLDSVPEMELSETTYELLSDEDFENLTN